MSDDIQVQSKKWYLSKTLWSNFVMGCMVLAVPSLKEKLTPDVLAGLFMVVNILLRLITKDKLELH